MRRLRILTRDALVLLCVALNPSSTLREIADRTASTERAVQTILSTLKREGLVSWNRDGRKNRYSVDVRKVMEHEVGPMTVGELVRQLGDLLAGGPGPAGAVSPRGPRPDVNPPAAAAADITSEAERAPGSL
jgi:hypothetical protein